MSQPVLEQYIRQLIESHQTDSVNIAWQGGEPTLMGLDFYRRTMELVEKYRRPGMTFLHTMQTNGTLLDEEWARFLKQHRFLVGLSIDGPRDVHDRCRLTKRGAPTFDAVYAAAKMLRRFGVAFNTLTCVHRFNASRPLDVYRFLRRELGSTYLQFIPTVEIKGFETIAPQKWDPARLPVVGAPEAHPGHPDSVVTDWSVDPRLLAEAGHDPVAGVGDGTALLEALETHQPDLALVDIRMPPTFTHEGSLAATEARRRWPGSWLGISLSLIHISEPTRPY